VCKALFRNRICATYRKEEILSDHGKRNANFYPEFQPNPLAAHTLKSEFVNWLGANHLHDDQSRMTDEW